MKKEEFHQLAEAIAKHLSGWSAQPGPREFTAIVENKVEDLSFLIALGFKGRLHISPCYNGLHQHIPYGAKRVHITIDPSRQPAHIAADITHRFLPDFRNQMTLCKKQANLLENSIARTQENAKRLRSASLDHLAPRRKACSQSTTVLSGYIKDRIYIEVEVNPDTSTMTISNLPTDLAADIITTLATNLEIHPC